MRAVVVMVAAGWLATATVAAWAAGPTAAQGAKVQTSAHKHGIAKTVQRKTHKPTHKPTQKPAYRKDAKAAHAKHDAIVASRRHPGVKSHATHTPRQASAHKPAAARPAPRHKLMVDAPMAPSVPAVSVKRANPPPHELPPILS